MIDRQYTKDEVMDLVTHDIIPFVSKGVVVAFRGLLGVGKTTLVQEILRQLGVKPPVVSPTFSYVNEYFLESGEQALHFDLFRISSPSEFDALGFGELIADDDALVFIEWPEVIHNELINLSRMKKVYLVEISYGADGLHSRHVSVVPYH